MSKSSQKPHCHVINSVLVKHGISLPDEANITGKNGFLKNDSRAITDGDIFCAIIGHDLDGRAYIEQAISQGASLVLCECEQASQHGLITWHTTGIAIVHFHQLNKQLFALARAYYQSPQSKMSMIGVTGTNGKTSTTQLIAQFIALLSKQLNTGTNLDSQRVSQCAVIGTNGAGSIHHLQPVKNTTPSALELHQLFHDFIAEQFTHVAMEVSSHALEQTRVTADLFNIAVFTNLTRDHLDYHGSMENYAKAKRQLFVDNQQQIAVLNFDDEQVKQWLAKWPKNQTMWLYGRSKAITDYKHFVYAKNIKHHHSGVDFTLVTHLGDVAIQSPLLGDFNIDNLLAAIAVALADSSSLDGASSDSALAVLANLTKTVARLKPIAGRMESYSANSLPTAVVDYAHTPDALEKALLSCKTHCHGSLYVIFGCGGDRDKGKRPLMAQAAEKYADYLVITNDNPRTESPEQIAKDMQAGIQDIADNRLQVILDREKAVLATLNKANADDIVLLAGKGHEDYIILGTEKIDYNERNIVKTFFENQTKAAQESVAGANL